MDAKQPQIDDQRYLKEQQYKTAANLEARINLHVHFGTGSNSWTAWVFNQMALTPGMWLLELGCGPGSLWKENLHRLPKELHAFLGDLSNGMLEQARQLLETRPAFAFVNVDAQHIPMPSEIFDLVVANHMLYHVPDLPLAFSEIHRMLKPGGRLVAATNGIGHMQELHELIRGFFPQYRSVENQGLRFSLENGPDQLRPFFKRVEVRLYEENLNVTEVEPLLAYIHSMWGIFAHDDARQRQDFDNYVRQVFAGRDHFFITKSQGLILARS